MKKFIDILAINWMRSEFDEVGLGSAIELHQLAPQQKALN